MTFKKTILVFLMTATIVSAFLAPNFLITSASAAYNPLTDADKNLSNLEKARIILQHFQKSGVDSDWAYDIKANKDIVEIMLIACVEMTDEEVSQLTTEEELSFYAYFQKLYEVSGLDATELGELFQIKDLEKSVDEIYHVDDKKAGGILERDSQAQQDAQKEASSQASPQDGIMTQETKKGLAIAVAIFVVCLLLTQALSRTLKRVNNKK